MSSKKFLFIVVILFFGCASAKLPLSSRILSVTGIPNIDDPIWSSVSNWPKFINKNKKKYKLKYIQIKNGHTSLHTFDFSEIDTKKKYGAMYKLISKGKEIFPEDYYFGPHFGWRPDRSISFKSMYDEKGNSETYSFYRNNRIAEMELYDREADCRVWIYFDEKGKRIGYSISKYEFKPAKEHEVVYMWNGEVLSEKRFYEKVREFKKNNKDNM
jgi:hypothetical protein